MKKTIAVVGASIIIAAAWATMPAAPRSLDALLSGAARSSPRAVIVSPQVWTYDAEDRGIALGSAIPLGSGTLLTAAHVIGKAVKVMVGLTRADAVQARIVWSSDVSDLAMLHAPDFRSAGVPVRCTDGQIGEAVVSAGWPMNFGYVESRGFIGGRTVAPFKLLHPRSGFVIATYPGGIQWITAGIGSGMSGGPTYDAQGRLVGVNVLGIEPFFGIVPASEICRALGRS